ncbi:MAG: hypothetical protein RBT63_00135 [Bdellovibrionales bacterium]|jgi:hypothetical protein|nr:hypothetical protein [Bdellovibrionales bacterium]
MYLYAREPLFTNRLKALQVNKADHSVDPKKMAEYFSLVSKNNLSELRYSLLPLSKVEQRIYAHIANRNLQIVHRIPSDRFLTLMKYEGLFSPRFLHAKYDEPISITNQLVWATPTSGWFFIKTLHDLENPDTNYLPSKDESVRFSHQLVVERDFAPYLALMAISILREMPNHDSQRLSQELLAISDEGQLFTFIDENKLGYLEVKIHAAIHLKNIDRIVIPRAQESHVKAHAKYRRWAPRVSFQ